MQALLGRFPVDTGMLNLLTVFAFWLASVVILTGAITSASASIALGIAFLIKSRALRFLTGGLWASGLALSVISLVVGFGFAVLSS